MKFKLTDIEKEINIANNPSEVDSNAISEQNRFTTCELQKRHIIAYNPSVFHPMVNFLSETKLKVRKLGLLYFGKVGTGKTFSAKVLSAFRGYQFYHADELVLTHISNPDHFWELMSENKTIIIDDLDAEPERVDYGSRYELLGQAIQKRYRLWQQYGTLTIITTNLSGKQLEARYSSRLYSRIKQMCECVNTTGEDLRVKLKRES
jgi:DNA replication protein DnaC